MPARALFHTAPGCVEVNDVPAPRPATFHPHQDVFAAPPADLIAVPAVDPAAATLFPPPC
ncbi:MAG TPA: hypothetical protein VLM11_21720 [Streptosporangiaceae bacterium]|nr:hypothetical protein [Streptosporangiaceae bacterium]